MSSTSDTQGLCPEPFLQENNFPPAGGHIDGRYCESIPLSEGDISCCMSCPLPDWKFPNAYRKGAEVANWLAVAFFALNGLLLLAYALLPPKVSHRHYLNVCLIVAIMAMELSFIIALAVEPDECYDSITPNDMKSDITCAFSGAFIIIGGWGVVVWSFCRTLSLHLQICWDVVPGKKFFYTTLSFGWIIPFAMSACALALSGVSYRFGSICHINHEYGLQVFWGPLMAVAAASLVIHLITLAYCIHIYVKSVMDDSQTTEVTSSRPTRSGSSVRTIGARQAYRRVKNVVQLQWRGIATVLTILGNTVYFAIIFLNLDASAQETPENRERQMPWIGCLMDTGGDEFACADEAASNGPSEAATIAVLILLATCGMWTVLFLGHLSMLRACFGYVKEKFGAGNDFVSVDAHRSVTPHSATAYEMRDSHTMKGSDPLLPDTPSDMSSMYFQRQGSPVNDVERQSGYFPRDATYTSPVLSFSTPRPPSAARKGSFTGREWDPASTFARGDAGAGGPYRNNSYSRSIHS